MTWVFTCDERQSFSFVDVRAFFTPGVRMMGTSNSLSSERAESSELLSSGWTSTSYSGILPLPLSDFGLGRDVFSSCRGSGRRIEALIRLFREQVSYEDTFFRRRVGLLSVFVRDAYMRNASEHLC